MQVLLHLSDPLARRFRDAVPSRQRSAFVARLLEAALPPEDKDAWLARVATEVQAEIDANPALVEDERDWLAAPGDADPAPFDFEGTSLARP